MNHDTKAQTRTQLAKIIDDGSNAEAADFTASMILDKCVVNFRADLPEVDGEALRVDHIYFSRNVSAAERRRMALRYLAVAEHLDAKEAREAEAAKEAELTKRRDALANELVDEAYGDQRPRGYASRTPMMRAAIDRIIEAEDKLTKYEAQA